MCRYSWLLVTFKKKMFFGGILKASFGKSMFQQNYRQNFCEIYWQCLWKTFSKKKDKKSVLLRYFKNNLIAFVIDFVKTIGKKYKKYLSILKKVKFKIVIQFLFTKKRHCNFSQNVADNSWQFLPEISTFNTFFQDHDLYFYFSLFFVSPGSYFNFFIDIH